MINLFCTIPFKGRKYWTATDVMGSTIYQQDKKFKQNGYPNRLAIEALQAAFPKPIRYALRAIIIRNNVKVEFPCCYRTQWETFPQENPFNYNILKTLNMKTMRKPLVWHEKMKRVLQAINWETNVTFYNKLIILSIKDWQLIISKLSVVLLAVRYPDFHFMISLHSITTRISSSIDTGPSFNIRSSFGSRIGGGFVKPNKFF